jgi:uncharacterized membrane protein
MYVEFLSLLTAFCYGLNAVLIRKGMKNSNPLTGTFVAALVQVLIMLGLTILFPSTLSWTGIAFFVAAGILAGTLGRLTNYMSIERLGVPISASVIGSSPLFSMIFAVLLIGEEVTMAVLIGTVLVVVGIVFTRIRKDEGNITKSSFILPLLAAAFYGASSPVRKIGLNILPEPVLGSLVGAAASFVFFSAYFATGRGRNTLKLHKDSIGYFAVSGIIVSIGWISMFTAQMAGSVSVVSTLIATNPLFSLVLSLILLRGSEEIHWRTVVGCIIIVVGVSIITLF